MLSHYKIAASILSADFACLGNEVEEVTSAGADIIHFDVMDNHYVPNLTCGAAICKAIRPYTQLPIDVHLMAKPVDTLIIDFAKAGADIISFHVEAAEHIDRSLSLVKELGCQAGIVFNPATPLTYIDHVMDKLDVILLMSVNPGFAGQSLIPSTLHKIKIARQKINDFYEKTGKKILLEIDGGVKEANIIELAQAGADNFVMGSAIFDTDNYKATITSIRQTLYTGSLGKVG